MAYLGREYKSEVFKCLKQQHPNTTSSEKLAEQVQHLDMTY